MSETRLNKYEELVEWLKEYDPLYEGWIYFNVVLSQAGTLGVNSVVNERELESFINGSRRVEFLFAVVLTEEYDTETTNNNLKAIKEFDNISAWIETQNEQANFPNFGDNVEIEKVESLQIVPSVAIDPQAMVVKYQGQFKITYIERR